MGRPTPLTDTHCHIHEADYVDSEGAYQRAQDQGVARMICVGTDLDSSRRAVAFANSHPGAQASIALHPHIATEVDRTELAAMWRGIEQLAGQNTQKIIAIGECGLDYFYHSDAKARKAQQDMLRRHITLAAQRDLPLIFHVREAFADFWPIFDEFSRSKAIKGVLHSFTDSRENADIAIKKGLFIGVNGISTFTKDPAQQAMFAAIPLNKLLIETDAPYLTPIPLRGKVNEPAYVKHVALFHATVRGVPMEEVAAATSNNATQLFSI